MAYAQVIGRTTWDHGPRRHDPGEERMRGLVSIYLEQRLKMVRTRTRELVDGRNYSRTVVAGTGAKVPCQAPGLLWSTIAARAPPPAPPE